MNPTLVQLMLMSCLGPSQSCPGTPEQEVSLAVRRAKLGTGGTQSLSELGWAIRPSDSCWYLPEGREDATLTQSLKPLLH